MMNKNDKRNLKRQQNYQTLLKAGFNDDEARALRDRGLEKIKTAILERNADIKAINRALPKEDKIKPIKIDSFIDTIAKQRGFEKVDKNQYKASNNKVLTVELPEPKPRGIQYKPENKEYSLDYTYVFRYETGVKVGTTFTDREEHFFTIVTSGVLIGENAFGQKFYRKHTKKEIIQKFFDTFRDENLIEVYKQATMIKGSVEIIHAYDKSL
jgi:hypothetical protein